MDEITRRMMLRFMPTVKASTAKIARATGGVHALDHKKDDASLHAHRQGVHCEDRTCHRWRSCTGAREETLRQPGRDPAFCGQSASASKLSELPWLMMCRHSSNSREPCS